MRIHRIFTIALLLMGMLAAPVAATEYFVARSGDDNNDGQGPATAFATIQRGVDALDTGDTLTIAPGEYFEAIERDGLGGEAAPTTIQAQIPGTVLIRGDVPAPVFQRVEGYRFVYSAPFPHEVQAVNEVDTLNIFQSAPDLTRLEQVPGGFYYDAEAQTLYISTSDLQPVQTHHYTVSVAESRGGIFLRNPERVVIEGIAITGFHGNKRLPRMRGGFSGADAIPHGIYLWQASHCVIRNCVAYLNAGGLSIYSEGNNTIENAQGHANESRYSTESGNINIFSPRDETVRNCVTSRGQHGLRFYAGGEGVNGGLLEGNLSWANRGAQFQVKAGALASEESLLTRSVALDGGVSVAHIEDSLLEVSGRRKTNEVNNILLDHHADFDPEVEFADPLNMDFRLQATSRFRGTGKEGRDLGPHPYEPNIYYLSESGDDASDGLSVESAWRTLAHAVAALSPGDTLYLTSGTYVAQAPLSIQGDASAPVHIRAHGRDTVIIRRGFEIQASEAVRVERIQFPDGVDVRESSGIAFTNCTFSGGDAELSVAATDDFRVEHCVFADSGNPALRLTDVGDLWLANNLFAKTDKPAVSVDSQTSITYSDYNSYADPDNAWTRAGESVAFSELQQSGQDRYSIEAELPSGDEFVPAQARLAGQGSHGTAIGHYSRYVDETEPGLAGPYVHSVTDTTINLEWWTAAPTQVHLEWEGPSGEPEQLTLQSPRFGTFSLNGLEPGTEYDFRMTLDAPFRRIGEGERAAKRVDSVSLTVQTATEAHQPTVYHVSTEGSDRNDGLSLESAWRTLNHAADQVRPGDTVHVAGGVYQESVRIRATGETDKPITFAALPGHRVRIEGDGRLIDHAFMATNKAHLRFDGFYYKHFALRSLSMPWSDSGSSANGIVTLYRCEDVQITRSFHDGRGSGYGPGIVMAVRVDDLLLRNNVISDSMSGGVTFYACPDLRIEHNVFLRNKIQNISEAVNEPDQPFYVENNIFTDNLPGKVGGALFAVGRIESMIEDDNCYFFRIPGDERRAFFFYGDEAYRRPAEAWGMRTAFNDPMITELTQLTFFQYRDQFHPESSSMVADPQFAGVPEFDDEQARPDYVVDWLMGHSDLDFDDLFATNPDVKERGIGLQPEAFESFPFHDEDAE